MLMVEEKEFIAKVYMNKVSGQKLVTIPRKLKTIKKGDFVKVKKVMVVEI